MNELYKYYVIYTESWKYKGKTFCTDKCIKAFSPESLEDLFRYTIFHNNYTNIRAFIDSKLIKKVEQGGWPKHSPILDMTKVKEEKTKGKFPVVSISFGSDKTYDYLLENRSKQQIIKDQRIKIITGAAQSQEISIKHLTLYEKLPDYITKQLIVTTPTEAIVGLIKINK